MNMKFEQPPIQKTSPEIEKSVSQEDEENPLTLEGVRRQHMKTLTTNQNPELLKNWWELSKQEQDEFMELQRLMNEYHAKKARYEELKGYIYKPRE